MIRHLLTIAGIMIMLTNVSAQNLKDTVSLGANYSLQSWYSLENGTVNSENKSNWDIAFDLSSFGSSIMINTPAQVELWRHPGDTANFENADTSGLSTWEQRYNSDTSWSLGAFSRGAASINIGWGTYNTTTHIVEGDRFFVLKTKNKKWFKVWIKSLAGGEYTFRYRSLDGSLDQTSSVKKTNYSDKNFIYFEFDGAQFKDREPESSTWDLVFTQYTAYLPIAYPVSGVLQNKGVTVAEATDLDDPLNANNYSDFQFSTERNIIGYDWKSFQGTFVIEDSLAYFVKTRNDEIWRVVFTGFGGRSNGNFIFEKELLVGSSIENEKIEPEASLYPNPAQNELNILTTESSIDRMNILDESGRLIKSIMPNSSSFAMKLNISGLENGIYFLQIESEGVSTTRKFIKN